MKNPTIWESASRPLFVRTVWLEGSELRRGLQRHFLLDYETKKPLERLNSIISLQTPEKQTDTLKRSISLELNNDYRDFNNTGGCDGFNEDNKEEQVFLLGSAKLKLHEPFKLHTNKRAKLLKHHHPRTAIYNRKYSNYDGFNLAKTKDTRRSSDILDIYSRKNSSSSALAHTETANELLAERVLNWLDLAGKENFVKNFNELKEMEVKLSKAAKLRQDAIKSYHTKVQHTKTTTKTLKTIDHQLACNATTATSTQKNHKSSEAVKHITIIFNKEGQPIRFNRPAKNIDLCALSSSPSTTRRLAGTLASSRLYKSADNSRSTPKTPCMKTKTGNQSNKSAGRRLDTVADLSNSTLQKRLHEHSLHHDAKKQLHIFMPTLPKKGLNISVLSNEDGISELSHNFSELCRI